MDKKKPKVQYQKTEIRRLNNTISLSTGCSLRNILAYFHIDLVQDSLRVNNQGQYQL